MPTQTTKKMGPLGEAIADHLVTSLGKAWADMERQEKEDEQARRKARRDRLRRTLTPWRRSTA